MSERRYVVDVTLHSPGELELVLRDALPRLPGQRKSDVYLRRFIGVRQDRLIIHKDVPVIPIDEDDLQMFDNFTQRIYQDQRLKTYPELET